MRKIHLLFISVILLTLVSCEKEDTLNIFAGTTWKYKINMEAESIPDIFKDEQYYYALKFISSKDYVIVLEDVNHVAIYTEDKGQYKVKVADGSTVIYFTNKDRTYLSKYDANTNEIYGETVGGTYIKQP